MACAFAAALVVEGLAGGRRTPLLMMLPVRSLFRGWPPSTWACVGGLFSLAVYWLLRLVSQGGSSIGDFKVSGVLGVRRVRLQPDCVVVVADSLFGGGRRRNCLALGMSRRA